MVQQTHYHLSQWVLDPLLQACNVCFRSHQAKYKEGLTREQAIAIQLVSEAVCADIFNDLCTGSNVDVCVVTKGKTEYLRNHQLPNPRATSSKGYSFAQGQTEVLPTKITPLRPNTEVTVMLWKIDHVSWLSISVRVRL